MKHPGPHQRRPGIRPGVLRESNDTEQGEKQYQVAFHVEFFIPDEFSLAERPKVACA
jgi:hypothetical protein